MHTSHFVKIVSALRQTVEDMMPHTFHDTILRLFINDGKDSDINNYTTVIIMYLIMISVMSSIFVILLEGF